MKARVFFVALLAALLLPGVTQARGPNEATPGERHVMGRSEEGHGKPNPAAPPELSQFAFLIGRWQCEVKLKGEDGAWQPLKATWAGRYTLDGYAIEEEYRMTRPTGEPVLEGINLRAYNRAKKTWVMKWFNAREAFWLDLRPDEHGGVQVSEDSISFMVADPLAPQQTLSRATFLNISDDHFTWRGDSSADGGRTWTEFMVIECSKVDGP